MKLKLCDKTKYIEVKNIFQKIYAYLCDNPCYVKKFRSINFVVLFYNEGNIETLLLFIGSQY